MSTKNSSIVVILIVMAATIAGLALMPLLPERMASHWNAANQVDGYTSRFWGVFLMPLVSVALFLLFLLLPRIDPLKENIATFRETFNVFIVLLVCFLAYMYALTLIYNLGYIFNIGAAMLPAMGVFIYYAGVMIGKARRNFFIGIRTPWTLSNDQVWDETHRLGAWLFKASGILAIAGAFMGKNAIWFVMVPLLGSSLFLVVYSYVIFQRVARQPGNHGKD